MATADDGKCPEFYTYSLFTLTYYLKKACRFCDRLFLGAPAEIRTPDTLLKRQVLCRLSYWVILSAGNSGTRADMAGMAGFEPANARVKVWCLNQLGYTPILGTTPRH